MLCHFLLWNILDLNFKHLICQVYFSKYNLSSQVSLFQQILRNPDIFNFVDHSHHPVAVEVMKVN